MGRGPVRPINFREDGPRPCPAHQFFRGRVAARPGPSKFQRMGRGPAQTITISIFHGPARPGPSIFQKSRPGPARPITFSKVSARLGPARHDFSDRPGPARPRQTVMVTSPEIIQTGVCVDYTVSTSKYTSKQMLYCCHSAAAAAATAATAVQPMPGALEQGAARTAHSTHLRAFCTPRPPPLRRLPLPSPLVTLL